MFLLSKYYQYYSISGVATRRKVGEGGGGFKTLLYPQLFKVGTRHVSASPLLFCLQNYY